jgi:uncharacterized protein YkwD
MVKVKEVNDFDMFKKGFIAFVLLFFSCSSVLVDRVPSTKIQDYKYNDDEVALMAMINNYRVSKGLHALRIMDHASYLSSAHNICMIENCKPSHDGFAQRSDELIQLFHASIVSENIAYNYKTNSVALQAWLASPVHKKNIEGNFTHFGLSVRVSNVNKRKYYTNLFVRIVK